MKKTQIQRLMFLFSIAGLFAVTAEFACVEDVCADLRTGEFRTMEEISNLRIESLEENLLRSGIELSQDQRVALASDGQLFGVAKMDRPVKHPNGAVELPSSWLPEIPEGHPWRSKLGPENDAFYSFVEERLFKARLFDPSNPDHQAAAAAYLEKVNSGAPQFVGWTYAGGRTECKRKGGPPPGLDASPDADES